jgi:hypothetical protein
MAAPTFVAASTGSTDATGAWAHTCAAPAAAGNLLVLQVLADGTNASVPTVTSATNMENLAGTDNAWTSVGRFNVGSPTAATQEILLGRSLSTSAPVVTGANVGGDDVYVRCYEFTNVNTGTTLITIIENDAGDAVITQDTGTTDMRIEGVPTGSRTEMAAQSFSAPGAIRAVALYLNKTGSPTDNIIVEIQSDSAGVPSGTVVATMGSVAASTLSGALVTFTQAVDLGAGTSYWIVARRDGAGDQTNCALWQRTAVGTSPYVDGVAATKVNGTWGALTADARFIVYGIPGNGVDTSTTVSDTGVTTLGPDRLALQLVAANDNIAIDAFVGETGGDWVEAAAEYADSAGTDGMVQLQTAAMATAGTIDGGSDTVVSAGWGVVGFALIGTTVAATTSLIYSPRPMIRNI